MQCRWGITSSNKRSSLGAVIMRISDRSGTIYSPGGHPRRRISKSSDFVAVSGPCRSLKFAALGGLVSVASSMR